MCGRGRIRLLQRSLSTQKQPPRPPRPSPGSRGGSRCSAPEKWSQPGNHPPRSRNAMPSLGAERKAGALEHILNDKQMTRRSHGHDQRVPSSPWRKPRPFPAASIRRGAHPSRRPKAEIRERRRFLQRAQETRRRVLRGDGETSARQPQHVREDRAYSPVVRGFLRALGVRGRIVVKII